MDQPPDEPETEQTPRRPCESGNDRSDGTEYAVEKKKRRLDQSPCESRNDSVTGRDGFETAMEMTKGRLKEAMFERNDVEDGMERRRLDEEQFDERIRVEKQQFTDRMKVEKQKAIERRDELSREIAEARESLLQNGEGITFEGLPDDILYRIFSLLPFKDRLNARVSRKMVQVEKKAGSDTEMFPFTSLEVTVGGANSLSLRLMQSKYEEDYDASTDFDPYEPPYRLSLDDLTFTSALDIMRVMRETITTKTLAFVKFCHLSEPDRALLLETAARINGVASLFIKCDQEPENLCDRTQNTGPLPFSLLRPLINREWNSVVTCPMNATIEDLIFVHEKVIKTEQLVLYRVIGEDVGDGYRKHLKENTLLTDKVFMGTNEKEGLRRPELMRVRRCPVNGEKVVSVEDDEEDGADDEKVKKNQMIASVIQNKMERGQAPTFDIVFGRTYREYTNAITKYLVQIN